MHIEGSYTFQAPREAVWDAIMDPAVMGAALPGGEKLEKTSDTEYEGVMNVRVGPVQGKFQGKVVILEADKPASCTMSVDGRGTPGFLSGTGAWQLAAEGDATVNELAEPYDMSLQAVSRHLKVLEAAGLVSRSREAQRRPAHLEAQVFDLMSKWIERYRLQAEERYRRLDAVLAELDDLDPSDRQSERIRHSEPNRHADPDPGASR